MAEEMGMHPASKYQYYEDRFKGADLPFWVFAKARDILMRRGITKAEMYQLLPKAFQDELMEMNAKLDRVMAALGVGSGEPGAKNEDAETEDKPKR
jgi:hypothetical protein